MAYLAKSAHCQFLGLMVGFVGWIITTCLSGVNDWRIWYVDDESIITGGVAWVGVWRVCFNSYVLDSTEFCRSIRITDSFTPPEIAAAQVLCMIAIVIGVVANLVAGYAVRMAYFGVYSGHIRLAFVMAGSLYWLTAACSLVPVLWNMSSVLANLTIDFPTDFCLPPAPLKQDLGPGIGIGIGSSILLIISGLLLLCYKCPVETKHQKGTMKHFNNINGRAKGYLGTINESTGEGIINPAFETANI